MENFEFLSPVKIFFGNGRIRELGEISKNYGKKALVVTGKSSMKRHGTLERILGILDDSGIKGFVFDKVSPNPKSDEVDEAIKTIQTNGYEIVIGLGGGSAMDAAKAISVGTRFGSVKDLIGGKNIEGSGSLPVICIPTTSGSGAEVTKGAIITNTQKGLKAGVRGNAVFPKVALLDPELTYSMPSDITLETGFDALTHAIETYLTPKSTPITDLCSEKAIGLIRDNLPRVLENPRNSKARENMALASLLGGINIANTGTCLPHRLQQAMGSVIEISHGRGMATLYPSWLKRVEPYRKEKFRKIEEILCKKGYESVIEFMKKIGIYSKLRDFTEISRIDEFLDKVTGNLQNDPLPEINRKLMKEIYDDSF